VSGEGPREGGAVGGPPMRGQLTVRSGCTSAQVLRARRVTFDRGEPAEGTVRDCGGTHGNKARPSISPSALPGVQNRQPVATGRRTIAATPNCLQQPPSCCSFGKPDLETPAGRRVELFANCHAYQVEIHLKREVMTSKNSIQNVGVIPRLPC